MEHPDAWILSCLNLRCCLIDVRRSSGRLRIIEVQGWAWTHHRLHAIFTSLQDHFCDARLDCWQQRTMIVFEVHIIEFLLLNDFCILRCTILIESLKCVE